MSRAAGESTLVTAIILLNAERTHINDVAEQLAEISGISEVYSVSGSYDLIAMVRVKSNEELSDLVTQKMKEIDGITRTESMLAFRAYSRHDLDAMFSI
jgi:DNA-binding Lrp family transcriptional regulator